MRGTTASKGKIFVCGVKPSLTYGEEIQGHPPSEIRALRLQTAKSTGLWGAGANVDFCWCLAPGEDPIFHAAATLRRYSAEWWTCTDAQLCAKDNLSARELKEAHTLAKE
eukprot:9468376-Pyramimonas_sp.AAC.1